VKEQLASSGVHPRELEADISKIHESIHACIPDHVRTSLASGHILQLKMGFGLGGPVGCGKSCAVAAELKHGLSEWAFQNYLEWGPDSESGRHGGPRIFWADWPEVSDYLLRHAIDSDSVDEMMAKMKRADILVLDDLGKERLPVVKDPNSIPFSQAQLDICIAYRNSQVAPIFWTTNLGLQALGDVYGPATFSRLIQDNPIEWLDEDLDNLRIR
jgi:DNA replication protein DnaC